MIWKYTVLQNHWHTRNILVMLYISGICVLTRLHSVHPTRALLLFSRVFMYEWQVGTNSSWSEHPLLYINYERIHQIVLFKGDILVIDTLL
jgi:hypothetical protein